MSAIQCIMKYNNVFLYVCAKTLHGFRCLSLPYLTESTDIKILVVLVFKHFTNGLDS